MHTLTRDQLKKIAHLIADSSLSDEERAALAHSVAGSEDLANRALAWLPEALGLLAISNIDGLILPTTFSAKSRDGSWHEFPLLLEPIYSQALELIGDPEVPVRAIAEKSSLVNTVENALNSGASLQGSVLSGPALIGIYAESYLPSGRNQDAGA